MLTASGRHFVIATVGDAGFTVDGELLADRRLYFTVEPAAFDVVTGR